MPEFNEISPEETIKPGAKSASLTSADIIRQQTAANYIVRGFSLQRIQSKFFKVDDVNDDDTLKSTKNASAANFGQAVFTNLEFESGNYQDLNTGEVISYLDTRLDTVLMSVSMSKNIVKTNIQGKSGTVKEYASDGDFEIDVRGVLVGDGQNVYPSDEVEALIRLLTVPETLTVTSDFLLRFGVISPFGVEGITQVVIESFSFPQREGFHNAQLFQFKMISDTPIELTI